MELTQIMKLVTQIANSKNINPRVITEAIEFMAKHSNKVITAVQIIKLLNKLIREFKGDDQTRRTRRRRSYSASRNSWQEPRRKSRGSYSGFRHPDEHHR